MKVFRGRVAGTSSELRKATFSGVVWADPIVPVGDTEAANVSVGSVFFSPRGRTYWHVHGQGQILEVTAGKGWICVDGGEPEVIRQGDFVWIPANQRHWHGAGTDTFMIHTATTLGGTTWLEEVAAEYPV